MSANHYDFGLSPAQEQRARQLHNDSIVFDLVAQHAGGSNIFRHYPPELQVELYARIAEADGWDKLSGAEYWPYEISRVGKSHVIRDWYLESGLTCGTYGIGVHDGHDKACIKLDSYNEVLTDLPWLRCVTTAAPGSQAPHPSPKRSRKP